jgi:hypothetical protein
VAGDPAGPRVVQSASASSFTGRIRALRPDLNAIPVL